jgi:cytochrome c556
MRIVSVVVALLSLGAVGCNAPTDTSGAAEPVARAASQPPASQPYGTLAQMMRGIPFPNSNIIFDAQAQDPGAPKPPPQKAGAGTGATAAYANVYSGWPMVENSAVALSETANLIMIPGRLCENGKPVPLEREDFKKFAEGLAEAGRFALKAAQSKNQDAVIEAGGVVADACAACHEVYRDKGRNEDRCIP